jgi:hypothetical protein
VKKILFAAALLATAAVTVPILARSAGDADTRYAEAAPMGGQWRGDGEAMPGRDGPGMRGWPMMHHMREMMRRDPQEWCMDRLARRAARRAYAEAKLDLTAEQRPLWDKVQSAAQAEAQKERQLCSTLKPGGEATLLDRMDRMQQFLSVRLEALQSAKPAVQALYQALTPEQRTILDHPFRRP